MKMFLYKQPDLFRHLEKTPNLSSKFFIRTTSCLASQLLHGQLSLEEDSQKSPQDNPTSISLAGLDHLVTTNQNKSGNGVFSEWHEPS